MKKLLTDIASIHSGYTFRQKVHHKEHGGLYVIQYRDITDQLTINTSSPARIAKEEIPSWHFLEEGDLLFMAKSSNNQVLVYNDEFGQAVATSMFLVIRANQQQVLPQYLAWYINQQPAQQFLASRLSGSIVANLSKKELGELKVPLPSFVKQRKIADIHHLSKREEYLRQVISHKRSQMINQLLLNQVK